MQIDCQSNEAITREENHSAWRLPFSKGQSLIIIICLLLNTSRDPANHTTSFCGHSSLSNVWFAIRSCGLWTKLLIKFTNNIPMYYLRLLGCRNSKFVITTSLVKKNMSILVLFNVTDTRHAVGNDTSERQLPNYQFCVVIMISSRRTKHSYQHGKPHGIFHLGGQVLSYTNTECHGARLFELKAVQSGLSRHWPWVSIHLEEVVLRV